MIFKDILEFVKLPRLLSFLVEHKLKIFETPQIEKLWPIGKARPDKFYTWIYLFIVQINTPHVRQQGF